MAGSSSSKRHYTELGHSLIEKAGRHWVGMSLVICAIGTVMWLVRDTKVTELRADFENCKKRVQEIITEHDRQLDSVMQLAKKRDADVNALRFNLDKVKDISEALDKKFLHPIQPKTN